MDDNCRTCHDVNTTYLEGEIMSTTKILEQSGPFYNFQPGNGTRYALFAVETGGRNEFNVVIAWLKYGDMGGPAFRFAKGGDVGLAYFMSKTDVKYIDDAAAILLFCQQRFGVKLNGIPDSVTEQKWWPKQEAA